MPHERSRQGQDRPFRLPARLPFDVCARRRAAGRQQDRPRARRQGQRLHGRRHLRQGRALCRTHPSSRPADASAAPQGPEGLRPVRTHLLGRRPRYHGRGHAGRRAQVRAGSGLALLLCRHHGPRHARRYQPAAPCQALRGDVRHHLHDDGVDGLHRRHRQAGRARSARDGQVGHGGDLGDEPGQHASQRDDACRPRPQGARRQDRRGRHLSERHHAAGRPGAVPAARHGRRARLWRHARAVPRRPCQLAVHGAVHRLPARAGGASARQDAGMGERHHRPDGCRDRDLREDGRHHAQDLLPAGLRLLAPAQRRPQHARGAVHSVGDGRVAARRRRRLPQQRRHLPLEQVADRRPGRGRSDGARAGSVPYRPDPDGRPGRPQGRPAGRGSCSSRT